MRKSKVVALAAAALVAGLALGSVGIASAAPTGTDPADVGPLYGSCLQLGNTIRNAGARMIDIVADLTGLSAEEIRAERTVGQTLAEVAEDHGVSTDDIVGAAMDARAALLQEKVDEGLITQEQADEALEYMSERLSDRLESGGMGQGVGAGSGGGPRGNGLGGGMRGGMRGGLGGPGTCGATPQGI